MQEEVYLPVGGPIPGIPGDHGPGTYTVNWDTRTATMIDPPLVEEEPVQEEPPV